MADIIQLLPDHVANQIAAGEVVQRPASVVKELLENAIDAKATSITLVIKDAGKTLVQVTDNGIGMSVTDARLSFERHATSKIKSAEDLFNLHTKGFRGEALASIAAIAHVELKTKTENSEIGTHLTIEGSKVISQDPAVVPKGTTISVKNLFYNIPARRNFLKSNPVETRHIIDEFHRVALAHPNVAFQMLHNGSDVFNLPSTNSRQRIVNIFGSKTNEKLVPVHEETEILKIEGFVLKPEFGKKSRGEQFFFVNDRFIKSPYLHHAVSSAFEGLMKNDVHPGYFLFLEVDPHSIDINIHPTKTEIKFDDEHSIYAMLRATVKHSLGQFNIAPVLDFERDKGFDTPYEYSKKSPTAPSIEVDRDFNPFKEKPKQGNINFPFKREQSASWESLYVGLNDENAAVSNLGDIEFESEEVTGSLFENTETETGQTTFQLQNK
jgi:DNA mismatch repair protein MutL